MVTTQYRLILQLSRFWYITTVSDHDDPPSHSPVFTSLIIVTSPQLYISPPYLSLISLPTSKVSVELQIVLLHPGHHPPQEVQLSKFLISLSVYPLAVEGVLLKMKGYSIVYCPVERTAICPGFEQQKTMRQKMIKESFCWLWGDQKSFFLANRNKNYSRLVLLDDIFVLIRGLDCCVEV